MNKLTSLIVGVVAVVLSAVSAAVAAYYRFSTHAMKHALLFAVIFVVLLAFGILCLVGIFYQAEKGKPEAPPEKTESVKPKPETPAQSMPEA